MLRNHNPLPLVLELAPLCSTIDKHQKLLNNNCILQPFYTIRAKAVRFGIGAVINFK